MGEEIIIVSIVFGSIVGIVFLAIMSSIIKTWINNRGGKSVAEDEEFLNALREFKYKTDRRLANLEAIVTDENPEALGSGKNTKSKTETQKKADKKKQSSVIEIEDDSKSTEGKSDEDKSGNLRNMLKN